MRSRSRRRRRRHQIVVWSFFVFFLAVVTYSAWGIATQDHQYHFARSFCPAGSYHPGMEYSGDDLHCYNP